MTPRSSSLQTPHHLQRSSLVCLASLVAGPACGEPPREEKTREGRGAAPVVEKAELLTLTDASGFPGDDGAPNRPDQYARDENGELFFLRPDTGRTYYIVIPDAAPPWLFDAFVAATDDIESASPDDCLSSSAFVPTRESGYRELPPAELLGSSATAPTATTPRS